MTTAGIAPTVIAGGATVLGALGLYAVRRPSQRALDAMLGAAAGVMLAAVTFSLLVPAMEGEDGWGATRLTGAFLLGALATWGLQKALPHDPALEGQAALAARSERRITLLVAAVALHNIPEGLAVGVGVGHDPDGTGLALAAGIFLQNIPEGLAVAVVLAAVGAPRGRAVLFSCLTGVVEIVAGLLGLVIASAAAAALPALLAAAGGAMLFVVVHEIGPETSRSDHQDTATVMLILGFAAMVVLDAMVA